RVALTVGGVTRYDDFVDGGGSTALHFRYTVQAGDLDTDGLALGAMTLNGGSLTDAAGNPVDLTLHNVGLLDGVRVDTQAPTGIALSQTRVFDTHALAGATVGTVSATDEHSVSYALIAGPGGEDNGRFVLDGATLKLGGTP